MLRSFPVRSFFVASGFGLCSAGLVHCVGEDVTPSADVPLGDAGQGTDAPSPTTEDGAVTPVEASAPAALLDDATSVAAGRAHTCAITAAQDVVCWGSNGSGQLGVPAALTPRSSRPVKVDLGGKATAISAGANHTCAVMSDAKIKCWGSNEKGQLGRGTVGPTGTVDLVLPPSNADWVPAWKEAMTVSAGAGFTCAGVKSGSSGTGLTSLRVFCWGENSRRQAGTELTNGAPALLPVLITFDGKPTTTIAFEGWGVGAGDDFACATFIVAPGGAAYTAVGCWGSRAVGQVGSPPVDGFVVDPQAWPRAGGSTTPLLGALKPTLLAVGAAHACVRVEIDKPTLRLTCWGNNTKGQTGSPTTGSRQAEELLTYDATAVSALAAGGQVSCVIDSGQVKCIGANDVGQLGRGTFDTSVNAAFESVKLPPTASAISVGQSHACAVLGSAPGQKGQVACWGQNQNGQLGDGIDVETGYPGAAAGQERLRSTPVRVLAAK